MSPIISEQDRLDFAEFVALAEMLSAGGSSVHAVEIARAAGVWEDFRAADRAAYDLRRFARAVGQQGVRSLRSHGKRVSA